MIIVFFFCHLQVFFFAIVHPPGSHYVFNLAFERPFITFLTKQRVNSLTDDIHKDVPYWNAMECYFALNEISTPNPVDETKVRKEDIDTSENELNEIHDVRGEEFMDFNVDLNVLGDHRVHGDSPSDREKSLNNQGETRELKEDVVCNYRVTQQIGNAYDDSDIKNQLSLLIARVSNIERQAKYVQDDFFIRNQLSLFGARLSGFEQQMTQLMNTMGEVLIRCVTRSASGDQFGDQPSSQENVDKFKDVLKELKILELKIPSMIWDTWDVICRKANNAHISSNVTGQKIEVDTVLKKKIDEDTALKQKIEKYIALKKKIEEDTALKQKIEENTAFKQKIEEDTVLAKKLEKDTVLEKQIEEDIIYIHENEQLISAKEKESPINPIGADFDAIIKFLFDPNLDQSTWVINFGGRGCNRKNLMGLKPCEFIDGIVIDCVAFLCTRKSIEGRMEDARWYFPAIFAVCLCLI
ncbi:PREDICTED: uncharacterized protein LOC105955062 isoform X2 [Erythranthe guttata]|uniref:uncharacterized protein LOC105955062 isoform X2 n=1 Tax=Erythranthe guttata TaxID=4155 RepID=UPI00064D7773|nr:PREDICTED: uncharacterized protein LOC105955062 isoform X2 [Erythranthe guttata]|eukprot:XP_012834218.1 PREDICTED: uncharacterized protein LOC105955062 isoform X2 [Erythranthe guttata]